MANSKRTIGIAVASVMALIFIAVGTISSGPLPSYLKFPLFGTVNAASTHDLLVAYAAKDSDNDGLPDWEEALYGTDPNNPHTISPTLTDGQEVAMGLIKPKVAVAVATSASVDTSVIPGPTPGPSTLTDQFAQQLFGQYLSTHGNTTPTPDDIATFVEQGVAQLNTSQAVPDAYNAGEEHVIGSGSDALLSYAASADQVAAKYAVHESASELDYFANATEKNDTSGIKNIQAIGASYSKIAGAFIAVPVPTEAAVAHLAVANAFARLGTDITDMGKLETDPLLAYVGLAAYEKDAPALTTALSNLDRVFHNEGVVVPVGVAGSSFYQMLEQSAASPAPQS